MKKLPRYTFLLCGKCSASPNRALVEDGQGSNFEYYLREPVEQYVGELLAEREQQGAENERLRDKMEVLEHDLDVHKSACAAALVEIVGLRQKLATRGL